MPLYKNINLYIIFANTLVGIVSVSLIVPALPEIARAFDLSDKEAGIILASYTLPGVIFGLFMGILADKIGRKALIVPSILLFGVAGGAIYFIDDFFWINAMRFLQGIGGAILPSMSTVLIGDLFEEDVRLKVMGLNAAVLSVGTAAFPFVGGMMASVSWNTPFLAFWAAVPLAAVVALFLKEPMKHKSSGITAYFRQSGRYIFTARSLLAFLVGLTIFVLLYGGILTYLTLYMDKRFSMTPFSIGLYIATASFATAGLAIFSQQIEERMGRRFMMVSGFVLFAVAFFSILMVPSREWLIVSIMIFGAAMGLTIPLMQNIVTELSPIEYRGLLVSLLGVMIRLGQTLGPFIFAGVLYFGDIPLVFWACTAISVFFAGFLLFTGGVLEKG
ncbi:MAG: MFS transporter [Nitrospinota bacterium]